jgi:hypothetical protein
MNDGENQAAQKAHKLFKQEAQKREGETAWKEYLAQEEATRRKTVRLRALRLAREAAGVPAAPPVKSAKKAALRRS